MIGWSISLTRIVSHLFSVVWVHLDHIYHNKTSEYIDHGSAADSAMRNDMIGASISINYVSEIRFIYSVTMLIIIPSHCITHAVPPLLTTSIIKTICMCIISPHLYNIKDHVTCVILPPITIRPHV